VIDEKHGGFKATDKHPAPDLDADKVHPTSYTPSHSAIHW